MNARWNNIVRVAREVDDAFEKGTQPDGATTMRLARSVLDFQQQLVGSLVRAPARAGETRKVG
jgi:hypothetical protein